MRNQNALDPLEGIETVVGGIACSAGFNQNALDPLEGIETAFRTIDVAVLCIRMHLTR